MRKRSFLLVVFGCAVLLVDSAHGSQKQSIIAGSDHDEITLTQATQAGTLTLQPDTYVVQHHASHGQDSIRFMRVKQSQKLRLSRAYTGWYTDTDLIKAGEVRCRVRPLSAKAQATAATVVTEGGKPRITEVMIKGKAAMYEF
jgi:hypothetical protein